MTQFNKATLAKILEILGSDHAGEVVAAARLASAMVREAGFSWEEVLRPDLLPKAQVVQSASIFGDAQQSSVAVPSNAVTRLGDADVVFVKTAKGFEKRVVVIGGSAGGETVILQGLAAGEVIAISGLTEIKMTLGGE